MAKVYRGTQAKSQFVDTSDVFEKAQTDIALGEVVRETKRQKWKDDYEAVRKEQQDIESTGSEQFNKFVGNWSGAIQDQALTLKNGLESGNISSKDYTSNWGNLKSSNDELISSQKTYKARADKVYEDFNNGTGSLANVQALNAYNQKMNLKGLQAVTNENGGIDLFDKESKKIINTFGLSNLTNVNVQKFDRAGEAKALVDQFGKKITSVDGRKITTVEIGGMKYDLQDPNTPAGRDMNKAIQDSAMSSLLAGNNMASYLIDGNLGYTLDGEEGDPKTLTVKEDGTIDISEAAQAVAVEAFTKDIRNALGFSDIQKDKTMDDYQKASIGVRNRQLNLQEQEQRDEEDLSIDFESRSSKTTDKEGQTVISKSTVETIPEDGLSDDNFTQTKDDIENLFDNNVSFPGLKRSGVQIKRNEKVEAQRGRVPYEDGYKPNMETIQERSVSVFYPELMEEPVNVPMSEQQKYLVDIMSLLSKKARSKNPGAVKLKLNDFEGAFDDPNAYNRYNNIEKYKEPDYQDYSGRVDYSNNNTGQGDNIF